jgi:hypothetical protein
MLVNCENSSTRRPSASNPSSMSISVRAWPKTALHALGGVELDEPRIAADLAQLEQRIEASRSGALDALLGDVAAHLLGVARAQGIVVEVALAALQLDRAQSPRSSAADPRPPDPWSAAAGRAGSAWRRRSRTSRRRAFSIGLRNTG